MLLLLVSYIIMFVVFYGFGQIALRLWTNLIKSNKKYINQEKYNCFDITIIGMSALLIPLQLWSLFFAANHYFLGVCLVISITFFLPNRETLRKGFEDILASAKKLTWLQILLLFVVLFIIVCGSLWIEGEFDSMLYHHRAIRWTEEYRVIPGLANLEDRFGFNSNYILLSSIFSLRFLTGEPVYLLQSFAFMCFALWSFVTLFVSKHNAKKIVFFIVFIAFSILNVSKLFNTSTDILPNLLFFYLAANLLLSSSVLHKKILLFFIAPFLIATLKLSLVPMLIIPLYLFYFLYKKSLVKESIILLLVSSLIIILWLIRNVILSGYLIYPMFEIDLFSVDWKIPKEIVVLQKQYIYDYPISAWKETLNDPFLKVSRPVWSNLFLLGIFGAIIVLLPILIFELFQRVKHNKINISMILVLLCSSLITVLALSNGFDTRFICGALMSLLMLEGFALLKLLRINKIDWLKYPIVALFFLTFGIWASSFARDRFFAVRANYKEGSNDRHISSILINQYPTYDYMSIMGYVESDSATRLDKIDNKFDIYVSKAIYGLDKHPITYDIGEVHHSIFVDYKCLKARGETIQEGFRMDAICMKESLLLAKKALKEKGY